MGVSHLGTNLPAFFITLCSKVVRKSVARVLTVIQQNQRKALREHFKGKVRAAGVE